VNPEFETEVWNKWMHEIGATSKKGWCSNSIPELVDDIQVDFEELTGGETVIERRIYPSLSDIRFHECGFRWTNRKELESDNPTITHLHTHLLR